MSEFHDSALGSGSGVSSDTTDDALTVTAGDNVWVHVKWETNAATCTVDTGASTPEFSTANAKFGTPFSSQSFYWKATSTGTVTPRAVFSQAADFVTIRAISATPAGGTQLVLGNVNAAEGNGTAPSSGSASAVAAGASFGGIGIFASVTLTEGSGWTEPAEFDISAAGHAEYQLQTGSGSLTANGTISGGGNDWIAQLAIFNEENNATLEQEGFRWGVDDGNEASHGWEAAQDTDITIADNQSRLLRVLVDSPENPDPTAYALRYQKNGSGGYVAVPVGSTTTTSPPTAPTATVTTVGSSSDPWTINRPAASTGDMIVFVIAWDDSVNVTSVTAPAGVNSESAVSIAGPIASASTEMRQQAWYYIATGAWTTGTLSFDPSASETCRAVAYVIPAGQFNASDPIGFANTLASAATNESNVNSPTGTAESNDGSGRLYIAFGSDADALTAPGSNWNTINNATGGGVGLLVGSRDALVTNSESIAALTATIASDSWATLCFVVKPNVVANEVYVTTSANIAAGGEATTARLTAPSGKTTSDFTTGRRWDDENGTDTIDIAADFYTEVEWLVFIASSASDGDDFDFRVYQGASALNTYTVTPRWSIPSAGQTGFPGLTEETDSAFAVARIKTKALGLNTETDSALALTRNKAKLLGLNTETDSVLALTVNKAKLLGLNTETDEALPLTGAQIVPIGLVEETDSVLALTRSKARLLGLNTEDDSAFSIARLKSKALGLNSEVDAVLALTRVKNQVVGIVLESDTALAIANRLKVKLLGLAAELDEALTIEGQQAPQVQAIKRLRRGVFRALLKLGGR